MDTRNQKYIQDFRCSRFKVWPEDQAPAQELVRNPVSAPRPHPELLTPNLHLKISGWSVCLLHGEKRAVGVTAPKFYAFFSCRRKVHAKTQS